MGAGSTIRVDIELNNGRKCPGIGLDVSQIRIEDQAELSLKDVIYQSILNGVRLIVCEPANEKIVGEAIKMVLRENRIGRRDLFIVTKLEFEEKEDPEKALRKSLDTLGLNYVDLYLDHWPSVKNYNEPDKYRLIPVKETWDKMEQLVILSLTKSIGVCNYNVENLLNIISICSIKPVVNLVEFHPYLFQKDLKHFCDLENIKIFAYNPLTIGDYPSKKINFLNKNEGYLEAPLNFLGNKYRQNRTQIIVNWHMTQHIVPILGIKIKKQEKKEESQMNLAIDTIKDNFIFPKIEIDEKYIELLCSFTEKQYRMNNGSDIFGINVFA